MSKYQAIRGYLGRLDDIWADLAYIPFGLVDTSQYPVACLGAVVPRHLGENTVVWSDTPVILDETHDVEWQSELERGRATFYPDGTAYGSLPGDVIEVDTLRVLHEKGKRAAWQLVMRLEPYILSLVLGAARRVAGEVGSLGSVLDEVAAQEVTDELVSGGLVLKLVERLSTTEKVLSQSLGSYLHINLRSMTETAVRRRIGDPHVGRKIRRAFAESGAGSMGELLAFYKDRYPSEKVSEKRALAALSAGSLVGASALSFDETIFEESL